MRQRQDKFLREGIDEAEGEAVMVPAAVDAFFLHVVEAVVHPAHIPFVVEAETALVHGSANAWPRRAFFRDEQRARAA